MYRGVDLAFYGNQEHLEYDFTVAPGADPREIRLRFDGAESLEVSSSGALILHTPAGDVRHDPPVAYQEDNGSQVGVPAELRTFEDGTIGFEVGAYDSSRVLVIDPILVCSTYLGGSSAESCRGLVVDSAGTSVLVGDSFSSDFLRNASRQT